MKKGKEQLLREIGQDIEKLERKVSKCQEDFDHAQKKLQKANADLNVALSYRNFKFGSREKEKPVSVLSSSGSSSSSSSSSSVSSSGSGHASPVRDAIYNVLGKHNKPMRFKDIYLEVSKAIKDIGRNNVWLAISRMQHKGLIRKVTTGVYELVTGAKK